ncbi:MAG: hypothetical protein V4514_07580 [Pseudomonadota bacterium]|uniref:hypothetical protein n=1 Tax=unclassified Phenylobacterium TaxID=2640670 RepID=UPI0006F90B73|nr:MULTISPECIES: hypothetical protein [unclassified Phenylobacterium]KRB42517.1 hypothetical protein ASE02_21555 [Phenylobacterium sp. Root700]MBT9471632.1 hypothetical protein [Phenylobacterium sp.]
MKSWTFCIALTALAAASTAAADTLTFTPQPSASQKLGVASGKPALQSDGRAVSAVLVLNNATLDAAAAPIFLVGVHNAAAAPLNITIKSISAKAGETVVHVFTAEELRKSAQDHLTIAQSQLRARTDPNAGLGQSSNIGYVRKPGGAYLVDTTPQVGSNKRLAAEAQVRVEAATAALASADAAGFKPATIAAGENAWIPMTLAALPKKASTLQLTLTAAGETHVFTYAVTRQP